MTPICCFYCCHEIQGKSLKLPQSYDDVKDEFVLFGHFCSFECMKTYNLELNDSFIYKRFTFIGMLAEKVMKSKSQINFAPNKFMLKRFGGPLTIEEFRKNAKDIPYGYDDSFMRNNTTATINTSDSSIVSSYNPVPVSNEPLKLQRSKPLKNKQNTLEMTMGLFAT